MKTAPASQFISLGATFGALSMAHTRSPFGCAEEAVFQLRELRVILKASGFVVAERHASKLLRPLENELGRGPQDAALSEMQVTAMRKMIQSIWLTLEAEASAEAIYFLTDVRLSGKRLMVDVPSFFAKNVFSKLSPIAQYDFQEAGKCLAFARHTAAAFHTLRGTEAILRILYSQETGKKAAKKTWGVLIDCLRKAPTAQAALLNDLDSIRKHFRNPTQHPEHRYDEDAAIDLFNRCIAVVNVMSTMLPP